MSIIKKRRLHGRQIVSLLTAGVVTIASAVPQIPVNATELYLVTEDVTVETDDGIVGESGAETYDGVEEENGDSINGDTDDGDSINEETGNGTNGEDGSGDTEGTAAVTEGEDDKNEGASGSNNSTDGGEKNEGEEPGGDTPSDPSAEEIGSTVTNGDFETGDFTGWTLLDGTAITNENNKVGNVSNATTYWGTRSFYKQGNYFIEGAPMEGSSGAIRSSSFKLGGDGYIAFLIGGASAESKGSVKLYEENGENDTLIRTYVNKNWSDPATGNTLLRIYDQLNEYKDKELYFVVENGTDTGGFAFINVDDFHASMTLKEVQDLYLADAERIRTVEDEHSEYICGLYRDVTLYGTDTKVGEGLAAGEATLEAWLEDFDMEEDTNIDVVEEIRNATVIKDQFGIKLSEFDIAINSITYKETETAAGTEVKEDAESLLLQRGTYAVSYTISYTSKDTTVTADQSFTITVKERAEVGETVINGDFEDGLTGWKLLNGKAATDENNDVGIVSDEATYWGNRAIYKHGDYCLRGDSKEGKDGAIRSSVFKLGGDGYVSFLIGAAATEGKGCVRLYEEKGAEDALIKTYVNENWNDPKTGLTLIRVYDRLEEYIGKELYFVVENGSEAGFSFINVDDFRTSLTKEQVKALQDEELTRIEKIDDPYKDYIISCYRKNGIINDIVVQEEPDTIDKYEGVTINLPRTISQATKVVKEYSLEKIKVDITVTGVTYKKSTEATEQKITDKFNELKLQSGTYTVTYTREYEDTEGVAKKEDKTLVINVKKIDPSIREVENGNFETGDLMGWEIINEDVWTADEDGKYKGVISTETYWGEQLPYNQEGNYHVNGWEVTDDEQATWGIRSSVFTLAGSGYISVRMGGNAAQIKVYKLDGTQIGSFNQKRFKDANFPFVGDGDENGSWADMGTCFIDLHEYVGEPLYLELRDRTVEGGWAHAFFDNVKCYYEEKPDIANGYDTVTAPVSRDENNALVYGEVKLKWISLNNAYAEQVLKLSFEDSGFTVENTEGQKESAELASVFRNPAYQDAPVEPHRPAGVAGKALNFDGYSNYAEFHEDVEGSGLTIDAYVAPRAFMWDAPATSPDERIIETIAGSYDEAAKKGFVLGVTKHGRLAFRVGTGDNWYSLSSDADHTTPLYEWSRVTAVFDGEEGVMRLYLNGELAAEEKQIEEGSTVVASGKAIRIGKGSTENIVADGIFDGTMFPGLMDEITISLTALSDEEVRAAGWELPELPYEDAKAPDSALAGDWYRPTYHAVPPASWMNEPHALFRYNGKWHLFYQTNQGGPFWHNISWGHWVSDNMVNWKCVKDAVVPTEGTVSPDGVWTGNMIYTSDGEPLLLITLGDDSRPVNGSNQHVGLVRAVDYSDPDLTEWEIIGYAVAQTAEMGTPGEFRDAQAFGIGNERYMVVGGAADSKGVAHVFKTTARSLAEWEAACSDSNVHNGMNWEYKGNLLGDFFSNHEYKSEYGTVWEMPNIVPLRDANGAETDKYLFVFSPQHGDNDVWYYIGTFDSDICRFTPDYADAKLMDYGDNIFTGPTVYVNPSDGKVYICSIMQDNAAGENSRGIEAHKDAGWAFYAGLPRELYLKEDGSLGIKNIDTFGVEGQILASFSGLTVAEANAQLANIASDTVKIEFTFTGDASEVGFRLKKSGDNSSKFFITKDSVGLDAKSGAYTRGDTVKGVIYVDKCSIEAYVDEAVTVSGNKFFRGTGLEVFAEGDATCTVTVTQMNSIHGNAGAGTRPGGSTDPETPDTPDINSGIRVKNIPDQTYTGLSIKLSEDVLQVYHGTTKLTAGKDYSVSYKNNKAVGTATVTIKGKGNYKDTVTVQFNIVPRNINDAQITYNEYVKYNENKVQKPLSKIAYNGKKLTTKEYQVAYYKLDANGQKTGEALDGVKELGNYEMEITGTGKNYTGVAKKTIHVVEGTFMNELKITFGSTSVSYAKTSEELETKLGVVVKDKDTVLEKGKDYEVSFPDGIEVGTAKIAITAINKATDQKYYGSVTKTFKITGKQLKDVAKVNTEGWVNNVAIDPISGKAEQAADVAVLIQKNSSSTVLTKEDYTVSYSNNTKPGTATVTFTGKGEYTGSLKKTFKVTAIAWKAADLGNDLKVAVSETVPFSKKGAQPAVTVTYKNRKLTAGKDYKVTYNNNKAVTTNSTRENKMPSVTITGKGMFSGKIVNAAKFKIRKADLEKSGIMVTVADVESSDRAGSFISKPVVKESDGTFLAEGDKKDYTVKYYAWDTEANKWEEDAKTSTDPALPAQTRMKVEIKATDSSNYTGTVSKEYKIVARSISKATIIVRSQTYTGKAITLKPEDFTKARLGKDNLEYGTDYEIVSYENNVKKGNATVTVRGKGEKWGGEKKVTFRITSSALRWWWDLIS